MQREKILTYKPFSAANSETAERIISSSALYSMKSGEAIEYRKALGVVLNGEITVRGLKGGQRVLYRTINKGEVFGAAQLFGGDGAYTSLTARTECEIAVIPESTISNAITEDGAFALAFAETLCQKLRILNRKLSALSASDATSALCKVLLDMNKHGDERLRINSRTELASKMGISRMTLYRALDSLEKVGAIIIEEKDVIIKDINAIENLL